MVLEDWWKALASKNKGQKAFDGATWNAMTDWLLDKGREAEAAALVECRKYKPRKALRIRLRAGRNKSSWDWWDNTLSSSSRFDRYELPFRIFCLLLVNYDEGPAIEGRTEFREYESPLKAYRALFAAIMKAQAPDVDPSR